MKIRGICALALGAAVHATNAQLPSITQGQIAIELQQVASGLSSAVEMVSANDGSGRLFIVEQPGRIRILKDGAVQATPFLDVTTRTLAGGEQGLLGLAFHPGFSDPSSPGFRTLYTYSTEVPSGFPDFSVAMSSLPANHCVVAEWHVFAGNPDLVDASSRREILRIEHPQSNHNAGKIAFRVSDGYLYIAVGDGGNANDVGDGHTPNLGNAQDTSRVLGKILRIDPIAPGLTAGSPDPISVNSRYRIPRMNPFANGGGRAEIFAYGFRNPYRFSFDATTDQLIVGDVGQGSIEEVDIVELGKNYGWNRKEGSFLFDPSSGAVSPDPNPNPAFVNPVVEYDHGDGIAVIGGFIYRGKAVPALVGKYVFADFQGRLFLSDLASGSIQDLRIGIDPRDLGLNVKGIGSDEAGELYVLADNNNNTAGQVLKIVAVPPTPALVNLSTRARVEADENGITIAGLIITGSAPKKVVIRARGPSLGVNGSLTNPSLALHDASGKQIDFNDDWMTHPRQQEVQNAGRAPTDPRESAIAATLEPGVYTALMRGVGGATGVGLVELFDTDTNAPANAVNMSGRGRVQTGDDVMIAGLIIGGNTSQRILVRGIGPSLAGFGVANALQNPTLDLFNSSGTKIATNDNWRSDQQTEINASGFAPTNDAESAIIRTLTPGAYTAIIRGVNNTTGIGLVEVYRLAP
ncbi:MAG: PQQ-dependent sugar dehydrogenase [Chthoniobacterales bacterium]